MKKFYKNDSDGMMRILSKHKHKLLDTVHTCQKEIDCLDYLMFRLEHGKHEGEIIL